MHPDILTSCQDGCQDGQLPAWPTAPLLSSRTPPCWPRAVPCADPLPSSPCSVQEAALPCIERDFFEITTKGPAIRCQRVRVRDTKAPPRSRSAHYMLPSDLATAIITVVADVGGRLHVATISICRPATGTPPQNHKANPAYLRLHPNPKHPNHTQVTPNLTQDNPNARSDPNHSQVTLNPNPNPTLFHPNPTQDSCRGPSTP